MKAQHFIFDNYFMRNTHHFEQCFLNRQFDYFYLGLPHTTFHLEYFSMNC